MTGEEQTLSSRRIYEGRVINLRVDTVRLRSGRVTTREIVEHGGAVAIVAVDEKDQLVLVRQYRKPVDRLLLELPAGGLAPGEDPQDGAARELLEETGYRAGRMERLGGLYSSPGFCTEYLHIYLATDLIARRMRPEIDEDIEVLHVPLTEARRLVDTGEICDAKSIIGILLYWERYQA